MNIRSPLKKKFDNKAVNDIVGTLMLLLIAIGIFSVLYIFVFSIEVTEQPPSANIIGYVYDDKAYFEHWGGSPINLSEMEITFNVDGVDYPKNATDPGFFIDNEILEGDSGSWEIGEVLYYENSMFNNSYVSVIIVDVITNSFLMEGIIQRPYENVAPNTPDNPNPEDNDTLVGICTVLSWSGGDLDGDVVTYDVYF